MFLFIFEGLGTSELLLILVVALIIFGPRKLPQLSRSLGKSLADFRRASEEFKQTWEAELEREAIKEQQRLAASVSESNSQAEMSNAEISDQATESSPGPISVARTNSYENLIPEPEATQPSTIGVADSSVVNSELKSEEKHPIPIA